MNKKYVTIINPKVARYLLKKGFIVTDIKPNRNLLNASVFVFLNEENLYKELDNYKDEK